MKNWKLVAIVEAIVFTYGAMLLGLCGGLLILDGVCTWLLAGVSTAVVLMVIAVLALYQTIHNEYERKEVANNG